MGNHRLKPTDQLVLALGPGVETLQAIGDRVVHALIETGLEMQPVKFAQAAPIAAI